MMHASCTWVVLEIRVPLSGLSIRLPYYFGDLNRDPNFDSYPYSTRCRNPYGSL